MSAKDALAVYRLKLFERRLQRALFVDSKRFATLAASFRAGYELLGTPLDCSLLVARSVDVFVYVLDDKICDFEAQICVSRDRRGSLTIAILKGYFEAVARSWLRQLMK